MSTPAPDLPLIFARALELDSPSERARYLAEACADPAVLRDVNDLLEAHAAPGAPSAEHVFSTMSVDSEPPEETVNSVIGPYKLLHQIGEGGMGVVYLAEQTHPLRRKVALKIIKPGKGSRHAIARFEAERQALAILDHPNIAKVLDAGATASGNPYFVMELVKGVPITDYCDRAQLTPHERLRLLVPVCHAIQHAHQKGIIHRDVKPSNVLVSLYDGTPVPKVIDFGVAKAIELRLTERTLYTQHGTIVGTLEYMSPEQAENSALDIDTRTDVYALGVLMYELLTGTTPLERQRLKQAGYAEILRRIREEEPPRLSARLSKMAQIAEIAARRRMEPAKLARLVRGELDWIALKALEKDRSRRYATANDLARDLERYLADEPVEAGPPSATYRLGKYARRHRVPLATAAAFALVLVAATAVSIWQAIRAGREQAKSRRAEIQAKAVLGFFGDHVLAAARSQAQEGGLGGNVTLREAVDAAEPRIAAEFAGQPIVEAAIRDTLGTIYLDLGKTEPAIAQLERALALRTEVLGAGDPDTLMSLNNLGAAYQSAGRFDEAIRLHEQDLAISRARLGTDHRDTLKSMSNLATAYRLAGRAGEAIPLLEAVLSRRTAMLGPEHAETLDALNNLATAYQSADRFTDALPLFERGLALSRVVRGPDHLDTATLMNNLASTLLSLNRAQDALPLFAEALEIRKAKLGPDHRDTLLTMNNLAAQYQIAGRTIDALPLLEEVRKRREARLGPDHPDTLKSLNNLALAQREAGQTALAIPLLVQVLARRRVNPGPRHPDTLTSMNNLAAAFLETHRWAEAERILRECVELRKQLQPDEWRRFHTMSQLGAALAGLGKYAEAEPLLLEGYDGLKAREEQIPVRLRKELTAAAARIVPFYEQSGNRAKAEQWRRTLAPPTGNAAPTAWSNRDSSATWSIVLNVGATLLN